MDVTLWHGHSIHDPMVCLWEAVKIRTKPPMTLGRPLKVSSQREAGGLCGGGPGLNSAGTWRTPQGQSPRLPPGSGREPLGPVHGAEPAVLLAAGHSTACISQPCYSEIKARGNEQEELPLNVGAEESSLPLRRLCGILDNELAEGHQGWSPAQPWHGQSLGEQVQGPSPPLQLLTEPPCLDACSSSHSSALRRGSQSPGVRSPRRRQQTGRQGAGPESRQDRHQEIGPRGRTHRC